MKMLLLMLFSVLVGGCMELAVEKDPQVIYNAGKDKDALASAEHIVGTKYDLPARLFIAQYSLARYLEMGGDENTQRISKYWPGAKYLQKSSRSHDLHKEFMWLARYYDAVILMQVKKDQVAARALLDTYCPQPEGRQKMRCHAAHLEYFERTDHNRYKQEAAFLTILSVGEAYHDADFVGHAMNKLAKYDIQHADQRARVYAARNSWNDEVMRSYCAVPATYLNSSPEMRNHAAYVAAYERANCAAYLAPADEAQAAEAPPAG